MIRDENHVADEDTEDIENQGQVMGQVQGYVTVGWGKKNPQQKPTRLATNMIVTCVLLVIEDVIPSNI